MALWQEHWQEGEITWYKRETGRVRAQAVLLEHLPLMSMNSRKPALAPSEGEAHMTSPPPTRSHLLKLPPPLTTDTRDQVSSTTCPPWGQPHAGHSRGQENQGMEDALLGRWRGPHQQATGEKDQVGGEVGKVKVLGDVKWSGKESTAQGAARDTWV